MTIITHTHIFSSTLSGFQEEFWLDTQMIEGKRFHNYQDCRIFLIILYFYLGTSGRITIKVDPCTGGNTGKECIIAQDCGIFFTHTHIFSSTLYGFQEIFWLDTQMIEGIRFHNYQDCRIFLIILYFYLGTSGRITTQVDPCMG